jgi:hypothetical protein
MSEWERERERERMSEWERDFHWPIENWFPNKNNSIEYSVKCEICIKIDSLRLWLLIQIVPNYRLNKAYLINHLKYQVWFIFFHKFLSYSSKNILLFNRNEWQNHFNNRWIDINETCVELHLNWNIILKEYSVLGVVFRIWNRFCSFKQHMTTLLDLFVSE